MVEIDLTQPAWRQDIDYKDLQAARHENKLRRERRLDSQAFTPETLEAILDGKEGDAPIQFEKWQFNINSSIAHSELAATWEELEEEGSRLYPNHLEGQSRFPDFELYRTDRYQSEEGLVFMRFYFLGKDGTGQVGNIIDIEAQADEGIDGFSPESFTVVDHTVYNVDSELPKHLMWIETDDVPDSVKRTAEQVRDVV